MMTSNPMRCIVTGGSQGIGEAIVEKLLSDGAAVAVIDRQEPTARLKGRVAFAECDVSDSAAMEAAAAALTDALGGPPDTVVANAGRCVSGRLASDPVDNLVNHFQINTVGVLNTFRPHISPMRAEGGGSLIAITSPLPDLRRNRYSPDLSVYSSNVPAMRCPFSTVRRARGPRASRYLGVLRQR